MKEQLKKHLDGVFKGAPHTDKNEALYEELLANLSDRYEERIAAGDSEEEACRRAIGDLGDIRPLIETAAQAETAREPFVEPPIAPDEGEKLYRYKWRRGLGTACAVALFILAPVPCMFAAWMTAFLFLFVAAGVVTIILTHRGAVMCDRSARAYDEALCRRQSTLATVFISVGVALCILSFIPPSLIDNDWGSALFLLSVAVGVFGIVLGAHVAPTDKGRPAATSAEAPAAAPEQPQQKKRHGAWIAVLCGVVALAASITVIGLVTRSTHTRIWFENRVSHAYTEEGGGTVTVPVTALEIDWRGGSVIVEPYDGDVVTFSETKNGEAVSDPDHTMRWYLEDGELHLRYERWRWFHLERAADVGKTLTVYLPRDTAANMKTVDIDTVSAGVTLTGIGIERLDIDTVSGGVTATDVICRLLNVDTVSGDVTVTGEVTEANVDTVSGDLSLTPGATFVKADIDSVSGDVTLIVAATPGLTLEKDSVSGKVTGNAPMTVSGDRYVFGDGTAEVDVDTVSGNVVISAP